MKFKIEPGCDLFDQLQQLKEQGLRFSKVASGWVAENCPGATGHCHAHNAIWGGIGGVHYNIKPEGWKHVGPSCQSFYMPYRRDKKLWEAIAGLPIIHRNEFKDLIGYGMYRGNGIISRMPGFRFFDNAILIDTSECSHGEYIPKQGMVEILESVYIKLSGH